MLSPQGSALYNVSLGTARAEEPARLCPPSSFYRLSHSTAGQAAFCQVLAPTLQDMGLCVPGDSVWKLGLSITQAPGPQAGRALEEPVSGAQ